MTTTIIIGNYSDHQEEISSVRYSVFVEEQKIPKQAVWDERDLICRHVLVRQNGKAVATGRIDLEKEGKVGRVAVLASARKYGFGQQIMDALEQQAKESKLPKVWFNAQISAIGFYERLGYQVVGNEFIEAGIVHRMMQKKINNMILTK